MKHLSKYYKNRLPLEFYLQEDVCAVARSLIGKLLVTHFEAGLTVGRIVETEAYNGVVDKASHAYGGRFTQRTRVMYEQGGRAYVYLCYGIHHLFNVVTHHHGTPHAVLIRGIEPVEGLDIMLQRMSHPRHLHQVGRGPGNVSRALGLYTHHTNTPLTSKELFLANDPTFTITPKQIHASPRIGVAYAAEDALLPYRYYLVGNPHVSGVNLKI